ncbi:hypothetical protein MMC24_005703 [Lignoscripta atroalba]|nr:hypothetical protein [Lignoscripta atroalba]
MEGYLKEAGFEDVTLHAYRWPVGPWSKDPKLKELGKWSQLHLLEGLEGMVMALLTRVMGWELTEVQAWLGKMRAALENKGKKYHAYHDVKFVYGRKPMDKPGS